MKKEACIFLVAIFLFSCKTNDITNFSKFCADKTMKNGGNIFVNEGTSLKSFSVIIDGITYKIAFRNNRVVYVETRDKNFISAEGLSLNSCIAECLNIGQKLEFEPGIGFFMRLKNGWRVYLSNNGDNLKLSDNVMFFCCMDETLSHCWSLKEWINYISSSVPPELEATKEMDSGIIFVSER